MNSQGAKIPKAKHLYFSLVSQPTSPPAHENTHYQLLASSSATELAFPGPWEADRQCLDGHEPTRWIRPCGNTLPQQCRRSVVSDSLQPH